MRSVVMFSLFRNTLDRGMRDWHSLAAAIVALGLGATILVPNSHADFSEEARVTAAVFADGDDDGRSVAISGDYAIVGAPHTDMLGENAGVAYLLERQAGVWSVVEKLVPSDANTPPYGLFGRFGSSVDIQSSALGTFAIVGAPHGIAGDGGVYVYERTGGVWSEVVKLTAPSPAVGRAFGSAVALSGGFLAVGAPNETSVAVGAGAVYMFIRVSGVWQFDSQLVGSGLQPFHGFGSYVDMVGSDVIASAPVFPSTVYVFHGTLNVGSPISYSWNEDAKILTGAGVSSVSIATIPLTSVRVAAVGRGGGFGVNLYENLTFPPTLIPPPTSFAEFGHSVSLVPVGSTLTLAVGAPLSDVNAPDAGRVYLYERTGTDLWSLLDTLDASDASPGDDFGRAVSLSAFGGDARLIAGAPGVGLRGIEAGAAYVFEESASVWTEAHQQLPWDDDAFDRFAESVAIDGGRMLIGAPGDNGNGLGRGSVYAFEQLGGVWTPSEKLPHPFRAGSFGTAVALSVSGTRAIIGAPFDAGATVTNAGAVYLFERIGGVWTELDKVTPLDGSIGARFGAAVDLDGDVGIVGSPGSNAAYVFEFSSASPFSRQRGKLEGGGVGLTPAEFGTSVSIRGDRAVVGDPREDDASFPKASAGGAYVFRRAPGWTQEARMGPPPAVFGRSGPDFGASVATDGGYSVVGAPGTPDCGAAYVWRRTGTAWSQMVELSRPAVCGRVGENFGQSVDLDGLLVVVGEAAGADPGTAWVFYQVGNSYVLFDSLIDTGGVVTRDLHGSAVSIDGFSVAVGAPAATATVTNAGAANVYAPEPALAGALAVGGLALLGCARIRARRARSADRSPS